jgi:hypothetical protein
MGLLGIGAASAGAEWFDTEGVTCRYVEAGPEGPSGNVLRIDVEPSGKGILLHRDGSRIQVFVTISLHIYSWRERALPLACTGTPATVRNIDRIAIFVPNRAGAHLGINESGGPVPEGSDPNGDLPGGILGPGATPERRGSEIEIGVFGPGGDEGFPAGSLLVVGTNGNDRISVGNFRGRATVNLNGESEQGAEDFDISPMPGAAGIAIHSAGGNDLVFGRGGDGLAPLSTSMPLWVSGGPGRDRLLGHQGLDRMLGGSGPDVIRGLGGNDDNPGLGMGLSGGYGPDRVWGGSGNDFLGGVSKASAERGSDRVYGGPGRDDFTGNHDLASDLSDCGPGRDGAVQFDFRLDRLRRCELR